MDKYVAELEQTLDQINTLMNLCRAQAQARGTDYMMALHDNGTPVMGELVIAKANTVSALISAYQFQHTLEQVGKKS